MEQHVRALTFVCLRGDARDRRAVVQVHIGIAWGARSRLLCHAGAYIDAYIDAYGRTPASRKHTRSSTLTPEWRPAGALHAQTGERVPDHVCDRLSEHVRVRVRGGLCVLYVVSPPILTMQR